MLPPIPSRREICPGTRSNMDTWPDPDAHANTEPVEIIFVCITKTNRDTTVHYNYLYR